MLTLFLALFQRLFAFLHRPWRRRPFLPYRQVSSVKGPFSHHRRKPQWVRREIVRLAALLSRPTCRAIAEILSRRFAQSRKMTVGRTFVNSVLRAKRYEIEVEKRRIKNAKPRQLPRNRVWGLDLTGKTDTGGRLHFVLGLLDHGTRANMSLVALVNKSSFALLGHLFLAIGRFGKPRAVRTDNEPIFTSRMFRFALALLGIRHQRTDPGCPWQNGRIERFFGTLKERLDRLAVDSAEALNGALAEFRFFYNHVRPHQNLAGFTPAEAWAGVDPFRVRVKDERWFEAWDGLLTGYYLRR
jgi:transposase InsO family protein